MHSMILPLGIIQAVVCVVIPILEQGRYTEACVKKRMVLLRMYMLL